MLLQFPRVLEGLGSSGRLVGFAPTYFGTSPTSWSGVMAKTLPARIFVRVRYEEWEQIGKPNNHNIIATCEVL